MPRRTECARGHDLTVPGSTSAKPGGQRQCRACKNASQARSGRARRKALGYVVPPVPPEKDDCSVAGCDRPRTKSGGGHTGCRSRWCSGHLSRLALHGDLYEDVPLERSGVPLARRREELRSA